MAASVNNAEKNIKRDQLIVRIASIVFLVAAIVLGLAAAVFALGSSAYVGDEATLVAVMFWVVAVEAVFLLVLAILGFRAAHNRFAAKPFAVVATLLAAYEIGSLVVSNYRAVSDAFTEGPYAIAGLVFILLAIVAAFAGWGLVNYNKRHPEDEIAPAAPEYVPDSMKEEPKAEADAEDETEAAAAPAIEDAQSAIQDKEPTMTTEFSNEPLELRLDSKLMSIHNKMDVLDAHDNVIYQVSSKAVAINDRTFITDAAGNEVANIHAKVLSIHGIYYVEMADGVNFEMSRELLHLNDVIDIDALGWQLRSRNMLAFDFDVCDKDGNVVASCGRKVFSLRDTYTVQVFDREHTDEIVAIFVIMKHIVEQRTAEASDDAAHATASAN